MPTINGLRFYAVSLRCGTEQRRNGANMLTRNSLLTCVLWLLAGTVEVHAHFGHVGEAAGHGHLVGIGLLVAGGILAAVLAAGKSKTPEEDTAIKENDEEGVPEGEAA